MTQEEKQLILKDLCARLPYGVKVDYPCWRNRPLNAITDIKLNKTVSDELILTPTDICMSMNNASYKYGNPLPYLRPMSSMTEEENKQRKELSILLWYNSNGERGFDGFGEISGEDVLKAFDWLNAHHFDYRGLIEKGLALEAYEDMYN